MKLLWAFVFCLRQLLLHCKCCAYLAVSMSALIVCCWYYICSWHEAATWPRLTQQNASVQPASNMALLLSEWVMCSVMQADCQSDKSDDAGSVRNNSQYPGLLDLPACQTSTCTAAAAARSWWLQGTCMHCVQISTHIHMYPALRRDCKWTHTCVYGVCTLTESKCQVILGNCFCLKVRMVTPWLW